MEDADTIGARILSARYSSSTDFEHAGVVSFRSGINENAAKLKLSRCQPKREEREIAPSLFLWMLVSRSSSVALGLKGPELEGTHGRCRFNQLNTPGGRPKVTPLPALNFLELLDCSTGRSSLATTYERHARRNSGLDSNDPAPPSGRPPTG